MQWPGSVHDSTIYNMSSVKTVIEDLPQSGWLIGDSGYPQRERLLMTPFSSKIVLSDKQKKYQKSQLRARNSVERTIGILKSRFRCLDHKSRGALPFDPEKSAVVIACCIILHNYCRRRNIEITVLQHIIDAERENKQKPPRDTLVAGNKARTVLINKYF